MTLDVAGEAPTSKPATALRRRHRPTVGHAVAQVVAISWSLLCIVPFVLIVLLAFKDKNDIFGRPLAIFGVDWRLENFVDAWNGPPGTSGFATFLVNSVIVAVVALSLCVSLGSVTAFFMSIASRRVSRLAIRICLLTTVLPIIMLLIPYFSAFSAIGLLSSPVALGVTYGVLCLPTTTLILNSFYQGFPSELRDAAAIDGLTALGTFRRIVLPLSKGPIVAVALLNGFFIWGETQLAIVLLQDPESRTVPVGLLAFQGLFQTNTGALFAGLTIATVPVLVLYLVFHRSITKGIALGGAFR